VVVLTGIRLDDSICGVRLRANVFYDVGLPHVVFAHVVYYYYMIFMRARRESIVFVFRTWPNMTLGIVNVE
jgi:hypothetical protein